MTVVCGPTVAGAYTCRMRVILESRYGMCDVGAGDLVREVVLDDGRPATDASADSRAITYLDYLKDKSPRHLPRLFERQKSSTAQRSAEMALNTAATGDDLPDR